MIGEAKEWPTVDPSALRSWADCRTWADLDYMIAGVGGMIHGQAYYRLLRAHADLGLPA